MRAAVYSRKSRVIDGNSRSVEEQQADCLLVCGRNGWRVAHVLVDDDRSASRYARREREDFAALLRLIEDGAIDVVVTWEASRSTRDLEVYSMLRGLCESRGVRWCYSGRLYDFADADDRFATGLDVLIAEREAELTRKRVLRALAANAADGRPHGRLLYGYTRLYDARGRFVEQTIDEEQTALLREMMAKVLEEGLSCRAITADLNDRGVPSPRGTSWDRTQVRRMLTNPAYAGKRVYRGKIIGDACWPAVFTDDEHNRLVAILLDPRRRTVRDPSVKHLLTGTARCECGAPMRVQKSCGNFSYVCIDSFHVSIKTHLLETYVESVLFARLRRDDAIDLLRPENVAASTAGAEAAALRTRLDGFVASAALPDGISPETLARLERELAPKIAAAEARARAVVPEPAALRRLVEADDPEREWQALPIAARREVVHRTMRVRVVKTRRGARTFDPARVDIAWVSGVTPE